MRALRINDDTLNTAVEDHLNDSLQKLIEGANDKLDNKELSE